MLLLLLFVFGTSPYPLGRLIQYTNVLISYQIYLGQGVGYRRILQPMMPMLLLYFQNIRYSQQILSPSPLSPRGCRSCPTYFQACAVKCGFFDLLASRGSSRMILYHCFEGVGIFISWIFKARCVFSRSPFQFWWFQSQD